MTIREDHDRFNAILRMALVDRQGNLDRRSTQRVGIPGGLCAEHRIKRDRMNKTLKLEARITKGELDFGPRDRIFSGAFDGRRRKRVMVKIIGE